MEQPSILERESMPTSVRRGIMRFIKRSQKAFKRNYTTESYHPRLLQMIY